MLELCKDDDQQLQLMDQLDASLGSSLYSGTAMASSAIKVAVSLVTVLSRQTITLRQHTATHVKVAVLQSAMAALLGLTQWGEVSEWIRDEPHVGALAMQLVALGAAQPGCSAIAEAACALLCVCGVDHGQCQPQQSPDCSEGLLANSVLPKFESPSSPCPRRIPLSRNNSSQCRHPAAASNSTDAEQVGCPQAKGRLKAATTFPAISVCRILDQPCVRPSCNKCKFHSSALLAQVQAVEDARRWMAGYLGGSAECTLASADRSLSPPRNPAPGAEESAAASPSHAEAHEGAHNPNALHLSFAYDHATGKWRLAALQSTSGKLLAHLEDSLPQACEHVDRDTASASVPIEPKSQRQGQSTSHESAAKFALQTDGCHTRSNMGEPMTCGLACQDDGAAHALTHEAHPARSTTNRTRSSQTEDAKDICAADAAPAALHATWCKQTAGSADGMSNALACTLPRIQTSAAPARDATPESAYEVARPAGADVLSDSVTLRPLQRQAQQRCGTPDMQSQLTPRPSAAASPSKSRQQPPQARSCSAEGALVQARARSPSAAACRVAELAACRTPPHHVRSDSDRVRLAVYRVVLPRSASQCCRTPLKTATATCSASTQRATSRAPRFNAARWLQRSRSRSAVHGSLSPDACPRPQSACPCFGSAGSACGAPRQQRAAPSAREHSDCDDDDVIPCAVDVWRGGALACALAQVERSLGRQDGDRMRRGRSRSRNERRKDSKQVLFGRPRHRLAFGARDGAKLHRSIDALSERALNLDAADTDGSRAHEPGVYPMAEATARRARQLEATRCKRRDEQVRVRACSLNRCHPVHGRCADYSHRARSERTTPTHA